MTWYLVWFAYTKAHIKLRQYKYRDDNGKKNILALVSLHVSQIAHGSILTQEHGYSSKQRKTIFLTKKLGA